MTEAQAAVLELRHGTVIRTRRVIGRRVLKRRFAAEHFKPGTHYYVAPSGIMFHLGNGATPDYSQSFPFGKTVMPSGPYVHTDHPRFMFREAPEHA